MPLASEEPVLTCANPHIDTHMHIIKDGNNLAGGRGVCWGHLGEMGGELGMDMHIRHVAYKFKIVK